MKAVLIEWLDAVSFDPWEELTEAKKLEPHVIQSLGWLVEEDDKKIIIAGAWDLEREGVASSWAIPKTWLISMKEITLPE